MTETKYAASDLRPDPLTIVAHMIHNAIYQPAAVDRPGVLRVIDLFHHQVFSAQHPLIPHIAVPWYSMSDRGYSYLKTDLSGRHIRYAPTRQITTPRYPFNSDILLIRRVLHMAQLDIVNWLSSLDSTVVFEGPGLILFREVHEDQLWLYGNVWERGS